MVFPTWLAAACGGLLALGVALPVTARAAPTAWPQIRRHTRRSHGHVRRPADGLRYADPPQRDAARTRSASGCLIEAGSMQEAADQHGVAHLLEHMAFHGRPTFPTAR